MYGRPGACYVDIAGDMVNAKVDRSKVRSAVIFSSFSMFFFSSALYHFCDSRCVSSCRLVSCCPTPPVSVADQGAITEAISVLKEAKRPLVIVGKGNIKYICCISWNDYI